MTTIEVIDLSIKRDIVRAFEWFSLDNPSFSQVPHDVSFGLMYQIGSSSSGTTCNHHQTRFHSLDLQRGQRLWLAEIRAGDLN